MDERIQLETEGIKPDEVVNLNLDFVRCSGSIEGLLGVFIRFVTPLDYHPNHSRQVRQPRRALTQRCRPQHAQGLPETD